MMNELGKICSDWKQKYDEPTEKAVQQLAKQVWTHAQGLPESEVRDFVKRITGVEI